VRGKHPEHQHDHIDGRGESGTHHAHAHGRIDPSLLRSQSGIRVVSWSLLILLATSILQGLIYLSTRSVALLADLIHNFGDALTAVPLGIAFFLRSKRGERWAGKAVVLAIFISACVALFETIRRILHPQPLGNLAVLAAAGVIGFLGNELAAVLRIRAGRKLDSPALVADGLHARADGFVSLAVVASAALVALGLPVADPIIGLGITAVILRITWQAWRTVRGGDDR
jgi:cation diffusion facilitator family transporter